MNSLVQYMIHEAISLKNRMDQEQENWKNRILDQWDESKNYPRKMKKRVRKGLQAEWSIACYNPFENLGF